MPLPRTGGRPTSSKMLQAVASTVSSPQAQNTKTTSESFTCTPAFEEERRSLGVKKATDTSTRSRASSTGKSTCLRGASEIFIIMRRSDVLAANGRALLHSSAVASHADRVPGCRLEMLRGLCSAYANKTCRYLSTFWYAALISVFRGGELPLKES